MRSPEGVYIGRPWLSTGREERGARGDVEVGNASGCGMTTKVFGRCMRLIEGGLVPERKGWLEELFSPPLFSRTGLGKKG